MSPSVMNERVERAEDAAMRPPDPVSLPQMGVESGDRRPILSTLVDLAKRVSQMAPSQPSVPTPAPAVHARPERGFD